MNINDFDLTTEIGRKEALDFLSYSFESELRDEVEGFSNGLGVNINDRSIEVYIKDNGVKVFSSDVTIYNFEGQDNTISYGSSGEFNPNNKGSYWRTIHAALILQNWDFVIALTLKYCNKYIELKTQIGLLKNK